MPTAYIKKLAKLNHTTVNKIEKFWSQAKEIAKSEGNGKAWGLITTIFQNKLKKEGYKVKAFKEEILEVDDKEFIFKRLSLSDCVKQLKDLFYDYFNFGKKDPYYYEKLYKTNADESTASDLLPSDDFTVYIEYNNGSKWYSINNPKLKDLKLTGIKNCIIEYPEYTAYFGKDCRIERFDDAEDAPYVIKCEAKMKQVTALNENQLDNSTKALYDTMNEGSFQYSYRIDDDFMKFVKTTLTDEVENVISSDKGLIKKCIENRAKTHSIVWDALVRIFLYVIKKHNLKAKLSADKIKNWFAINHTNYKDALKPVIESVDKLREELRSTEK